MNSGIKKGGVNKSFQFDKRPPPAPSMRNPDRPAKNTDGIRIEVLDHGYVELVEDYGSDASIIEAARMSTDGGFKGWGDPGCEGRGATTGDEKLLRYLYENKHSTPFEMAGAIIEVQAPIFVFREWHRHRTQSYNEMSSRYIPLPDVNYVPTVERLMRNAGGSNKQAGTVKGSGELTATTAHLFRQNLQASYSRAQNLYEHALAAGVPKELARVHLPVGRYSRMRAHANLRNWLAFLTLRKHPAAQWEIQQYAEAVHTILSGLFPRTLALFDEGQQA